MNENRNLHSAARALQARGHDTFLVQVGAMDGVTFDPVHSLVKELHWKGLLVEPLPDLFQELRSNYQEVEGLVFENCAIASYCGTIDLYRVPLHLVRTEEVPAWAAGISSVFSNRNAIGGLNATPEEYAKIKESVIRVPVPCMTLPALLRKHGVDRVDVLQIDAEGSDLIVLSQLDFGRYHPFIIHVEFYNLPRNEQQVLFHLLLSHGYTLSIDHKDALATKLD